MTLWGRTLLISCTLLGSATAAVAGGIDPFIQTALSHRARTGATPPFYRRHEGFERTGKLPVIVRFRAAPSAATIRRLEMAGVMFSAPIASGPWLATLEERSLGALSGESDVESVTLALYPKPSFPLDLSWLETGADAARRATWTKDGMLLDGTGTLIADIDSPVFVFHPAFFKADAGTYAWIDVDKDGAITPGVDGVDLSGDGRIQTTEVLRVISAHAYNYDKVEIARSTDAFDPSTDYLYLDTNRNQKRDYGAGFTEDTPAYGEPLFVFDDADKDGHAATDERLYRLGTSKFRAFRLHDKVYERGSSTLGLIQLDNGSDDPHHGTGVAGILVGGVPGFSRWLGIAPGAELLGVALGNNLFSDLQWTLARKPNVLLIEFGFYGQVSLDGSSEPDRLIDNALPNGVVTVTPAGNLAVSNKHRTVTLTPGDNTLALLQDSGFDNARGMGLSLHHRAAGRNISVKLSAFGQVIDVPPNAVGTALGGGLFLYAQSRTTSRGTQELHFEVAGNPVPSTISSVTLTLDAGTSVDVDAYVWDTNTDWGGGLQFDQNTPSRTLCEPATADSAVTVAAYTLHDDPIFQPWAKRGGLSGYSSEGPRLDGIPKVNIAAPDNPLTTALPSMTDPEFVANYAELGGTSSAGPHVAGALALLHQIFPAESATNLKQRLLDHARHDADATPGAVTTFGAGKLDVAAAGLSAPTGTPPTVTLRAPATLAVGDGVALVLDVQDADPSTLRARWDLDYDGTPETPWAALAPLTVKGDSIGQDIAVRAEVLDANGFIGADTALIRVVAQPAPTPQPPKAGGCGCQSVPSDSGAFGGAIALLLVLRRRRSSSAH